MQVVFQLDLAHDRTEHNWRGVPPRIPEPLGMPQAYVQDAPLPGQHLSHWTLWDQTVAGKLRPKHLYAR